MRAQYKHLTTMPQNTASLQTVRTLPWNENSFFFFPWTFDTAAVPRPLGVKAVPSFFLDLFPNTVQFFFFVSRRNDRPCTFQDGYRVDRKPRFANLSLVRPFFSKYLSTCTYLSLISSCIVVPKKSILILHTFFVYTCDLLIIIPYVLRKCVVTWCPFSSKPVSSVKNIGPNCRAHLQGTLWRCCPLSYPLFCTHIKVCFDNDAFPLSAER